MAKVNVLNAGYVELLDVLGSDTRVVEAARVSNAGLEANGEVRTPEADRKLITYLLKNGHWSPFQHCVLTFTVKLPVFVARQWMRHSSFAFNEVSMRYREIEPEFYVPELSRMSAQSTSNKQASGAALEEHDATVCQGLMENAHYHVAAAYQALLGRGLAKELARAVLPVSTYTEFYATCSLRSLLHFVQVRSHEHAQHEIRVYSDAMRELASARFPVTLNAWKEIHHGN